MWMSLWCFVVFIFFTTLAQAQSCKEFFLSRQASLAQDPISIDFHRAPKEKSVLSIETRKGQHGGDVYLLKKTGQKWFSQFQTFTFDLQGDPRWFIGALGEKVARFFGFEIIDENYLLIPSADEFQRAINKVNVRLKEQGKETIEIQIVSEETKSMQRYLDLFLSDRLRFAEKDHHLVHDMSFHSGVILTPRRLHLAAQKRLQFVLDFYNFLSKDKGEYGALAAETKKDIELLLTRGVDNGTAFGNLVLIAENSQNVTVRQNITSLVSRMSDAEVKSEDLAVVPAAHLVFGVTGTSDVKLSNKSAVYSMPHEESASITLEYYTIDLMTKVYFAQNQSSSKAIEPYQIARYLKQKMDEFKTTDQGKDYNFNLATVFSPHLDYAISYEGVQLGKQDALNLKQEYLERAKEIVGAVLSIQ